MNAIRYYLSALLPVYFQLSFSLAPHELTFLIISQNYSFSANLANELKNNILHQIKIEAFLNNNEMESVRQPRIILSHETFQSVGSWAITPILAASTEYIDNIVASQRDPNTPNTSNLYSAPTNNSDITSSKALQTKWLILCEDQSIVDLKALINNLKNEDYTKDIFLGYPLRDSEATIIHHFAFFKNPSWFLYPLFRAGVAISIPLLKKLADRTRNERFGSEFFIDASHELSLFAWNNGKGHSLTMAPYFCLDRDSTNTPTTIITTTTTTTQSPHNDNGNGCAIYSRNHDSISRNHIHTARDSTQSSFKSVNVTINQLYFAVKTWSKNHIERLPILLQTWAKETKFIRYFSDVEDASIPTISTNVVNTEVGHCDKTIAILRAAWMEILTNKQMNEIKYVVLSDDDTLFSISTMLTYLQHFDPNMDIYLGERYGYQLLSSSGFNYITGGGGIVFSLSVIEKLVENCQCPSSSSPDDMIIGLCLQYAGIEPIHSSRFHQARPIDYPAEVLFYNDPISFHKFWQINPYYVYEKWLTKHDRLHERWKYLHTDTFNYCSENQNEVCHETG